MCVWGVCVCGGGGGGMEKGMQAIGSKSNQQTVH